MDTQTLTILAIVAGGVGLIFLISFLVMNAKYNKLRSGMKDREVDEVDSVRGVRYTIDQTVVDEKGDMNVSYGKGDVVLNPRETHIVARKGDVKPGKYTILGTHGGEEKFNLRIGTFVKEYAHNEEVVLSEGQEVTAVNTTVILR